MRGGRQKPPYFLSVSMMADKESSKETLSNLREYLQKQVLIMEAIRQNGKIILHSDDGTGMKMIFKNLTGKNFQGREYAEYIRHIAIGSMGFSPGIIEHCRDGEVIDMGTIPNV